MNSNRHSSRVWNPAERRARRNNRKKRRRLIVKTALITMFAACFGFGFVAPSLTHQCTDLFGDLVSVRAEIISLFLYFSVLLVQLDHFVY